MEISESEFETDGSALLARVSTQLDKLDHSEFEAAAGVLQLGLARQGVVSSPRSVWLHEKHAQRLRAAASKLVSGDSSELHVMTPDQASTTRLGRLKRIVLGRWLKCCKIKQ